MKKKILFVIDSLGAGGAEMSLVNMLSLFDYSTYDVDLQLSTIDFNFVDYIPKEVNVLPVPDYLQFCQKSILKQLFNWKILTRIKVFFALRKNKRLKLHDTQCYWKYAKKGFSNLAGNYDVAIAWGQGQPTYYTADKVTARKKIAFINADRMALGYNTEFDYEYFSKFNHLITVSEFLNEKIKKEYPMFSNKITTIYDIVRLDSVLDKAKAENPYDACNAGVNIVTVGRLVKEKGYDLAIEASKVLMARKQKFRWFIVGEGRLREELSRRIKENHLEERLILVGEKKNPYPYVHYADIYVQCSRSEGFCITLKEAKILNKPIVSTNFETARYQITDGQNGLLVDMSGESIAQGISLLIDDEALRAKLVDNLMREEKSNKAEIYKLYQLIEE